MKKIALITGATSGIGQAAAKLLAKNDFNVIITGRRNKRLEQLEEEIIKAQSSDVYTLNFDVRNKTEVEESINSLPDEWKNISVLINNAGLASGVDPVNEGDYNDWDTMVDTNVKGLLYVSRTVSKIMVKNKSGHIINVSSIAGRESYPNGSVYCGTKHAVEAITKSMRLDLLPHNIKVSRISPGMVETEFSLVRFHGDVEKADNVYNGFTPLYAEDVADTILFMITRPDHVNIDDVLIMPTAQGAARDVFKGKRQ
ncbi:MAG TPA: SDR family NAD(P)-dependent oxidoreductase [Prolixibacteraceae bacterium]|nr:SDR family NAD(P)-dependent oxidoreductase [Prolixibacteraceae bacterium]